MNDIQTYVDRLHKTGRYGTKLMNVDRVAAAINTALVFSEFAEDMVGMGNISRPLMVKYVRKIHPKTTLAEAVAGVDRALPSLHVEAHRVSMI